ncbi:MAG: hypothetical protein OXH73_06215 [Caldilineaceae bacterium]|nr:hypothetical protein [Caldilineaceae bacterium]
MNSSIHELLEKVEFVVDVEGQKKAVMLDYSIWKDLVSLLEDIEDSAEIEASRNSGEEVVSWDEAKAELRSKGING